MGTHRTPKTDNPGSGGRGSTRRRATAWQAGMTKAEWAERAEALEVCVHAALSFMDERHNDPNDGHSIMLKAALRGALAKLELD